MNAKATLIARFVSSMALIVLLAFTALLVGATASSAAPTPTASDSYSTFEEEELEDEDEFVAEESPDWEEEGWEEEELGGTDCELGEDALAEGLLTVIDVEELCAAEKEWEAELEGHDAGPSCALTLRSARARVATHRNRLELAIDYAVEAPTRARIEIRAGKRKLASVKRHLDRRGVIHFSKRVGKRLGKRLNKRNGGSRVKLRIKLPRETAACPSRRLVLIAK